MSDTTRHLTPDERVPPTVSDLLDSIYAYAQNNNSYTAHILANVTKDYDAQLPMGLTSTQPETQPNPQTLSNQLVNALNSSDDYIRTLINHLPQHVASHEPQRHPSTKRMLQRSS